jgi:hypothetical protein
MAMNFRRDVVTDTYGSSSAMTKVWLESRLDVGFHHKDANV